MVEQVKAEERLARFAAGLSPQMQIEMVNALQGYYEQFYTEFLQASGENLPRAQGKLQAMQALTKTIQHSRTICEKIDQRRNSRLPSQLAADAAQQGMM